MMLHPVIIRELRVEARNPANLWLRVGTAAIAGIIVIALLLKPGGPMHVAGRHMFDWLNGLIYLGICLAVPVITADCLSREKREGTLGLMFLTPLRPMGIVISKSLVHGLRAASLVLVVVPVLSVVFLLGGVSWRQMVLALLLDGNALLLVLGTSVLASALCRVRGRAIIMAWLLFCGGLMIFFTCLFIFYLLLEHRSVDQAYGRWLFESIYLVGSVGTINLPGTQWQSLLGSGMICTLVVTMLFWMALRLAAWLVGRSWLETPLTVAQVQRRDYFFAPRFWRAVFQRRRQRALDANPIGWLHHHSLSSRVGKWAWFALCLLAESLLVAESGYLFYRWQLGLMGVLLLAMSFAAANSLLRERRSGAMELLMVAPLTHDQILSGGLKGVWMQFLPASLVPWLGIIFRSRESETEGYWLVCFLSAFLVIPVVGLYFSLRQRTFFAAWLLTILVAVSLPFIVFPMLSFLIASSDYDAFLYLILASQLCLGGFFGTRLAIRLKNKDFEVNLT